MKKFTYRLKFIGLMVWLGVVPGCSPPPGPQMVKTSTQPIRLDRIIQANSGPITSSEVLLLQQYPEKVYVTGASVRVVCEDGSPISAPKASQLLAGASIRLANPARHAELFQQAEAVEPNLFLFSQGLEQLQLPAGSGLPMMSNEPLSLSAEWMNRDPYLKPTSVHLEATIHFTRGQKLQPLRAQSVFGWALAQGDVAYFGIAHPDPKVHGPGCRRTAAISGTTQTGDGLGRVFQTKWWLPPGSSENHTLVDSQLKLPARVLAAAPYSLPGLTALSLTDLSNHSQIYRYNKAQPVATFGTGLELAAQHHYQLSCTHSNPTRVNSVGLAILMLYVQAENPESPAP